jgi:hypothetical protein
MTLSDGTPKIPLSVIYFALLKYISLKKNPACPVNFSEKGE